MAKKAAKHTCDCPNPPGGKVNCETDQLAICRVRDGAIEAECLTPPDGLSATGLANWALGRITGVSRSLRAEITSNDEQILRAGNYVDPSTGERVAFRMPQPWADENPEKWEEWG